jgi:tRNA nucleotidyltransferase (CCA-adding enzyme)
MGEEGVRDRLAIARVGAPDKVDAITRRLEVLLAEGRCYRICDLHVNGELLMQNGFPKGKEIGKMLSHLLEKVIEGELANDEGILLQYAKEKQKAGVD